MDEPANEQPKPVSKRQYTPQQRADALAALAANRNQAKTSRELGIPLMTLRSWLAKTPRQPKPSEPLVKCEPRQAVDDKPPTKGRQRRIRIYTSQQRTEAMMALAANNGNQWLTSRQLGIPLATIRQWSVGHTRPEAMEQAHEQKGDLAAALEELAWKLIGWIPEKVPEATLKEVAVALAICVDKMRLLRDQPTLITEKTESSFSYEQKQRIFAAITRATNRPLAITHTEAGGGIAGGSQANAGGNDSEHAVNSSPASAGEDAGGIRSDGQEADTGAGAGPSTRTGREGGEGISGGVVE